jgi:hypothetical protein
VVSFRSHSIKVFSVFLEDSLRIISEKPDMLRRT